MTATGEDRASKLGKLLEDFAGLKRSLPRSRKTIMEVSGYPHYENVVSNILAFFLDSTEEHGFGDLWARSLVECARADAKPPGATCSIDREVSTLSGKRLDILFSTRTYTVGIENKVFAGLYNDLGEYAELIDSTAAEAGTESVKVVLSLHDLGSQQGIAGNEFANVTYARLFAAVHTHLGEHLEDADSTWLAFMKDLICTIEKLESGDTMASAEDQFVKEHYAEVGDLLKLVSDWRGKTKSRARGIMGSIELPEDLEYWQDPFVYQSASGLYTCICIEIKLPDGHELANGNPEAHISVETYRNQDGWGAWIWLRDDEEAGKATISKLLDAAGIGHDGDNVVKKKPWDATDEDVVQLIYVGIDAVRKIL
ncbi:MAG: PD-(D/E)XK nuclease family protein [Coriobacteriales bacterium]